MSTIDTNLVNFISMHSISGNTKGNKEAVDFLCRRLKAIGFQVSISDRSLTDQPAITAHRKGVKSKNKLVIYGHYDVAEIKTPEHWVSQDPFVLEVINERIFCRGIADNKGTLNARLSVIEKMYQQGEFCPEILWLIQGEEEVNKPNRIAIEVFKPYVETFGARVYIDETGFNNIESGEQIVFLWSKKISSNGLSDFRHSIEKSQVFQKKTRIEYRHLNKFMSKESCPLLCNLPENAIYLGFGPNDKLHHIHRDNESLNIKKLALHQKQFNLFLRWYSDLDLEPILLKSTSIG